MRKLLVIAIVVVILGLIGGFAIPAFAHGPEEGEVATSDSGSWEAMHEACEEGDWAAMEEAAEAFHGEAGYGDCHGNGTGEQNSTSGWGGMMGGGWGGHMGGSMMGW